MYDSTTELLAEIAAGEDAYLEFKEVVFKDNSPRFTGEKAKAPEAIARVICSFANAEGGVLIFGINDHREVIGVDPVGCTTRYDPRICSPEHSLTVATRHWPASCATTRVRSPVGR